MAIKLMKSKAPDSVRVFNNVQMMNWAWAHQTGDGTWEQFDCLTCMVLESKWRQWQKDQSLTLKLKIGVINFSQMTAKSTQKNGAVEEHNILRTENKNRKRAKGSKRHKDYAQDLDTSDVLKLLNNKDLEWLAWNWRGWNNQKMFGSRRLMVFGHFNISHDFLPTPE